MSSAKVLSSDSRRRSRGRGAVDGDILVAIRDPYVGDSGGAELAPHLGADPTAGDAVFDPEFANGRVGVRQSEAIGGFGVGKVGWVEVHAQMVGLGPIDPALEMARLDFVAFDVLAAVIQVGGMKVEAMAARNEAEGFLQIAAQLLDGARLAGIIAGRLDAAAGKQAPRRFRSRPRRRPASNAARWGWIPASSRPIPHSRPTPRIAPWQSGKPGSGSLSSWSSPVGLVRSHQDNSASKGCSHDGTQTMGRDLHGALVCFAGNDRFGQGCAFLCKRPECRKLGRAGRICEEGRPPSASRSPSFTWRRGWLRSVTAVLGRIVHFCASRSGFERCSRLCILVQWARRGLLLG